MNFRILAHHSNTITIMKFSTKTLGKPYIIILIRQNLSVFILVFLVSWIPCTKPTRGFLPILPNFINRLHHPRSKKCCNSHFFFFFSHWSLINDFAPSFSNYPCVFIYIHRLHKHTHNFDNTTHLKCICVKFVSLVIFKA